MPSEVLNAAPESSDGFTLIELMLIVVVLAILSAIVVPNYSRYVARSQLVEATTALAHYHVRMEQYFRLHRSYANEGQCGVAPPANLANFMVSCDLKTGGNAYMATAIGIGETSGFAYTIDQSNVRATLALPASWGELPDGARSRWVTR